MRFMEAYEGCQEKKLTQAEAARLLGMWNNLGVKSGGNLGGATWGSSLDIGQPHEIFRERVMS